MENLEYLLLSNRIEKNAVLGRILLKTGYSQPFFISVAQSLPQKATLAQ